MSFKIDDIILDGVTVDPTTPIDGQIWYRSDLGEVRQKKSGVVSSHAFKGNIQKSDITDFTHTHGGTDITTNALDNTKLAQVATQTFKGRTTAATGNVEDLTVAQAKTLLGLTGTNSGDDTTTTVGTLINGATAKTTPVDADMVGLMDSAASNILKKLSWVNIKATLKTYFDTLYQAILVSGTNIKTINGNSVLGSGDLVVTGASAIFGTQWQIQEALTETTSTSTTYVSKATLTTGTLPAGDYRVEWSGFIATDKQNTDVSCRVQVDNTTTFQDSTFGFSNTTTYSSVSGFAKVTLTNATHFIDIDYMTQSGTSVGVRMKDVRINIFRIS